MPERQPGRPTEDEFIGAAFRYLRGEYQTEVAHISSGFYAHVVEIRPGKQADEAIIRQEQFAEGLPGERDSIRDFAVKQLSYYQKARKR